MKKNFLVLVVFIIILLLAIIVYFYNTNNISSVRKIETEYKIKPNRNDIIFGNVNAKKSVYLYASYSCRHCINFMKNIMPEIIQMHNDTINFRLRLVGNLNNKNTVNAFKAATSVYLFGNYEKFHNLFLYDFSYVYTFQFQDLMKQIMKKNESIALSYLDGDISFLNQYKTDFDTLKLMGTPTFIYENKILSGYVDVVDFNKFLKN